MLSFIVIEIVLYLVNPTIAIVGAVAYVLVYIITSLLSHDKQKPSQRMDYDEFDIWQDNQGC